eukprot:CAMPEP_0201938228 /NCGR_PEP_ID=MMETSP0903-20130614/41032_1 /ASSEMBLY_ACC=CAM_ASM_000552 /TAXON_ID=420261 /ORGANISM="Thalassiosira antarctica, Strain CCMP982" /LENGTH=335 /DNA_ID=CAMNT_0048479441 /DNA_START=225 /DNA_END=1229 /DNA_ORIENTATION=+
MSFNFDPFATPAPAPSDGNAAPPPTPAATPTATAAAPAIVNPFDNFGFTQTSPSNSGKNTNNTDWQQTARAAMSGNGVWKNASSKVLGGSLNAAPSPRSGGEQPKIAKRIVPYNSPISTLESNWDPWLFAAQSSSPQSLWNNNGNFMTHLIVRANDACCLNGGVESVLKWSKSRSGKNSSMMGIEAELGNFDSSLSFSESHNENGPSTINYGSSTSNLSASDNGAMRRSSSGIGGGGLGGGSMRFLKSGLKKAQASIERSVTTMAIKADGGKNPDQLCVSLHYLGGLNATAANSVNLSMWHALGLASGGMVGGAIKQDVGDVCLSRTDWMELPIG